MNIRFTQYIYVGLITIFISILANISIYSQCVNVALNKPATGTGPTYQGQVPSNSFSSTCGWWNSGAYCSLSSPAYIQVDLQGTYTINDILLQVSMLPNAICTHTIYTAPNISGPWTSVDVIIGFRYAGEILERCYSPALANVGAVKVETTVSPSWISWGPIIIHSVSPSSSTVTISTSGSLLCTGGSVTLTSSVGSSYLWSTGATTQSINVSSPGNYCVTVSSSSNSCIAATTPTCSICNGGTACTTVAYAGGAGSTAPTTATSTPICTGQSSTLGFTGGTLGTGANWYWYTGSCGGTYLNSGSTTIQTPTVNTTYYIRAEGTCNTTTCVSTIVILYANSILPSTLTGGTSICSGSAATIGVTGTLGQGANWNWYSSSCGGTFIASGSTITTQTLTTNTTYYVRAEGLCNTTACASKTIGVIITTASITSSTNVSCNGGNNGSATVTLSGGTGTPTYIWSDGQTTQTATGLAAGTYTVTVNANTGGTQCTPSGIELVTNGDFTAGATGYTSMSGSGVTTNPNASYSGYSVVYDHTTGSGNFLMVDAPTTPNTSVWCQTITVTPNTTYNFSAWVASCYPTNLAQLIFAINGAQIGSTFTAPATTGVWSQFTASWNSGSNTTATICITDQNTILSGNDFGIDDISFQACNVLCPATASVTIIEPSAISLTVSPNDSICIGGTASHTISASGGTPGYSYLWNPGSISGSSISVSHTTNTAYTVTATDANSCTATATTNVIMYPPPQPILTSNSPICSGDTLKLYATGGINFFWTGPNGYTSTQQNPVIPSASTSGTYNVLVSDIHQCTSTANTNVTVNPLPVPIAGSNSPLCAGDTLKLNVTGTGNFNWSGPSAYTSNSQNPIIPNATSVEAGSYLVTVTDANSCSAITSTNVIVNVITTTIGNNSPVCANTTLNVFATGGVSYNWSGPNGYISLQSNNLITLCTVLDSGLYSVTITDANGCSVELTTPVIVNSLPIPIAGNNTPICSGDQLDLTCSTDSAYLWSGPSNYSSTLQNPSIMVSDIFNNGIYTVTVTDYNGCTASTSTNVIVKPLPVVTISNNTPVCSGGIVMFTSTGGTGYTWSCPTNGFTSYTQNPAINGAAVRDSGYYTVTVTLNGCSSTATTHVIVYPLPQPTAVTNSPVCYGDTLILTATGGAYYSWSSINGFTSVSPQPIINNATDAASGIYTVTVTDYNGCISTTSTTAFVANKLTVSTVDKSICDGSSLTISAYAVGGTPPYSYYWNGNLLHAQETISPTSNTQYTAQVIDANGCISNVSVMTITILPKIRIKVYTDKDTVCPGEAALITIIPTQGQAPFHYFLPDGTIINSPYTAYTDSVHEFIIMGSDACGSLDSDTIKINVYPVPPANFNPINIKGCEPLEVLFHETSNYPNQTYSWDFGDINSLNISNLQYTSHIYESAGYYDIRLSVISKDGCKTIYTYPHLISVYPLPDAKFISDKEDDDILTPIISFINLTNIPNCRYYWNFGDGDSSNIKDPTHLYKRIGTYIVELVAVTNEGCRDTADKTVKITDVFTFYAPTAFSPTYDKNNDIFFVWGNGIDTNSFKLIVYDRWGEPIFETNKYNQKDPMKYGWDGMVKGKKMAEVGVYSWVCIYRDMRNIEHKEAGIVTVVR